MHAILNFILSIITSLLIILVVGLSYYDAELSSSQRSIFEFAVVPLILATLALLAYNVRIQIKHDWKTGWLHKTSLFALFFTLLLMILAAVAGI